MSEIDAIRAVDFDWAVRLKNIWVDPAYDVPAFNADLRAALVTQLATLNASIAEDSPLGWTILGVGGSGKTHLLSVLRREAIKQRIAFVLVDMTDVHDFWDSVLLGYYSSLQQRCDGERYQYQIILERFLDSNQPPKPGKFVLDVLSKMQTPELPKRFKEVIDFLGRRHREEIGKHQDVIRALLCLNSNEFDISNVGLTWLQGHPIEERSRELLQFNQRVRPAKQIVEGLSWLMSLAGPTVLAIDQLDPIATQLQIAAGDPSDPRLNEEIRVARTIIEKIAAGLRSLFDVTRRTFVVVSCLEATWTKLQDKVALKSNLDTFDSPSFIRPLSNSDYAEALVQSRLSIGFQKVSFRSPYPTWPFCKTGFENIQGVTPRQLLKICNEHRRKMLETGLVYEVAKLEPPHTGGGGKDERRLIELDQKFATYRQNAVVDSLSDELKEDQQLAPILRAGCKCLIQEARLPPGVDAAVEIEFQGGSSTKALHARIVLVHTNEGEREEHFCVRGLERKNPIAFQARLKAALTSSGIDNRLGFRRLAIVRANPLPSGQMTAELVATFEQAGGVFIKPLDDDLRGLCALQKLLIENDPHLAKWLHSRRPASHLHVMQLVSPALCAGLPSDGTAAETISSEYRGQAAEVSPHLVATIPRTIESANAENVQSDNPNAGAKTNGGKGGPLVSDATGPKNKYQPAPQMPTGGRLSTAPAAVNPSRSPDAEIPLGCTFLGDKVANLVRMRAAFLNKHAVVLAGSGSGKTVLVRRLVEEAALVGIPSVVIDCGNDLATLGDPWQTPPTAWFAGDADKAASYFQQTETIVWTPGIEAGNPLCLQALPDLSAVADTNDELNAAIDMACDSLLRIATTRKASLNLKWAVLDWALRCLVKTGGAGLEDLVTLLSDLPPDPGLDLANKKKLGREMADNIRAAMQTDPMLRGGGTALDPAVLFGDAKSSGKVRISVVNFWGLQALESQRQFLNQLAMTLFSWIKKNPHPPGGRSLRGLLVIDEAKDFVPGVSVTACKDSLMRLVNQARKYKLGVVFATQNAKAIDNKIIDNCSTHYYGKASSPAAIEVVREQIRMRRGNGDDIPTLPTGMFYVFNADAGMRSPLKVRVPMSLSDHSASPLDEHGIIERARKSRKVLDGLS